MWFRPAIFIWRVRGHFSSLRFKKSIIEKLNNCSFVLFKNLIVYPRLWCTTAYWISIAFFFRHSVNNVSIKVNETTLLASYSVINGSNMSGHVQSEWKTNWLIIGQQLTCKAKIDSKGFHFDKYPNCKPCLRWREKNISTNPPTCCEWLVSWTMYVLMLCIFH
jgi:hypothetical protein